MTFIPVDQEARERARRDHGTSFVLEAGAGTGKTTLLVDRIEQIVRSGAARLDEIAAVTFTENAATTMKLRLRERLERARADADRPAEERRRADAALEVLERAQVSTIHALCAALLGERPLECGVPPGFRAADDAEMDVLFAEAWEEWLTARLVAGDATLMAAVDSGIPLEADGWGERSSLRGLARTLVDQRDLRPLVAENPVDPAAWRRDLQAQAARARDLLTHVRDGDALGARLGAMVEFAAKADRVEGDALASYLRTMAVVPRHFGHKAHWTTPEPLEEARAIAAWTSQTLAAWKAASSAALHARLVNAVLEVVAGYEARKKERGVLDFLDLLVKARDALRHSEAVRRYFQERFRVVIIDEFQDTDPLQVEVAELLTGGRPGALVVVGDAKQSIYRFRRADVALFRRIAAEAAARPGHAVLHLTQNFRSRAAILRFVNRAFALLITPSDEAGQPEYEAIAPPPGLSEDASVIALRFEAPFAEGEDLLRAEAHALAAFLAEVAAGGPHAAPAPHRRGPRRPPRRAVAPAPGEGQGGPPAHFALRPRPDRAPLRRDAHPGRADGDTAGRGPGRQPGEGRRARAQGVGSRRPDRARVRPPPAGADPHRARRAGPARHASWRPRHHPHPVHPQGQGPGVAGGGALRHRRRLPHSRRPRRAVGGRHDRGGVPRGLPAAALGRAVRSGEGARGRGGSQAPLRGLHARARLARRSLAPEGRARGRILERPHRAASRALRCRRPRRRRRRAADDLARRPRRRPPRARAGRRRRCGGEAK